MNIERGGQTDKQRIVRKWKTGKVLPNIDEEKEEDEWGNQIDHRTWIVFWEMIEWFSSVRCTLTQVCVSRSNQWLLGIHSGPDPPIGRLGSCLRARACRGPEGSSLALQIMRINRGKKKDTRKIKIFLLKFAIWKRSFDKNHCKNSND